MRIPEIRERLTAIADEYGIEELHTIAEELRRRSPRQRASRHSTPMSSELRKRIREIHKADPDLPFSRIAAACDINPGRVSETLRGFRS